MYVFRALTDSQYQSLVRGIPFTAKDPGAEVDMQIHVLHTLRATPWISTTKSFFMLFSERRTSPVVRIDTEIAAEHGVEVFDISTDGLLDQHGIHIFRARNHAKGSREVLLRGAVPPEACTLLLEKDSLEHVFLRKEYGTEEELLSKWLKKDQGSPRKNILFLRNRINRYGNEAKGPLSRYKICCIMELVHLLNLHQKNHLKKNLKWSSTTI